VQRLMQAAEAEAEAAAAEMRSGQEQHAGDEGDGVTVRAVDGQVEVRWRDKVLCLSHAHFGKLRHMWQRHRRCRSNVAQPEGVQDSDRCHDRAGESGGGRGMGGAELTEHALGDSDQIEFARDLFALLLRYRTIRCSHFHAALPGPVFDWLQEFCGVQLEGMASPRR
jgi:hypothetical protein